LYPGSFDPGPMTSGARGPHGRPGWPGRLSNAQHDRSQSPARAGRGRRSGARNGGGKGAAGPDTHPDVAGGLGLAGGRPAVANLVATDLGFQRGNGDSSGG
jgi:hypothetical protein